jgi:exonuclease III
LWTYGDASNLILYANIQGFTSKKAEVINILVEKTPAIFCLSETHVTEDITNSELQILGYNYANCKSASRHTGGVMIYVRKDLKFNIILNHTIDRTLWVLGIKIHTSRGFHDIYCLYRSPCNIPNLFLEEFLNPWLENLVFQGNNFLITGDFNVDYRGDTTYSKKIKEIIESNGLKQHMNSFTRVTKQTKTLIDLVISNQNKKVKSSIEKNVKISDHEMICINYDMFILKQNEPKWVEIKLYKKINYQMLCEYLNECDWDGNDVHTISNKFVINIECALEKFVPRKIIDQNKQLENEPWFNDIVVFARKKRDTAYQKAKITCINADWESYKILRNKYCTVSDFERKKYYEEKIDNVKNDSKMMYKTLKGFLYKESTYANNIQLEFDDNNDKSKENCLNEYYVSSVTDINNSIPHVCERERSLIKDVDFKINNNEMFKFKPIELIKLKKVLDSLNKNKSTPDCITAEVLLNTEKVSLDKLLIIVNTAIETHEFPDSWKTSTIVPIPKIKNPKEPQDCRPVNLLPLYEKILEIILYEQLVEYIEQKNIICENQSGFRKKFSCETALQLVLSKWRSEANKGNITIAVMLDFKRAFETIDREILVQKLKKYGLENGSVRLMESYLNNRKQKTKLNGHISSEILNTLGVPQGSVLGPLLFILYINDICLQLEEVFVNLFADDTLISASAKSYEEACVKINRSLLILNIWLRVNKVKLNVSKSKCMLITQSSVTKNKILENEDIEYVNIDGENLEFVDEIKYLGVILDSHLKFNQHILLINKKVGKKINYLARVGKYLSPWTKLLIYKSIIAHHFEYCCTILWETNEENIKKLQLLQNKAMRVILRCHKYTSIKDMLHACCLLSIKQKLALQVLLLVHKIVNNKCPQYLCNDIKFNKDIHHYNTRGSEDITLGKQKSKFYQKSMMVSGFKLFNTLPRQTKCITNEIKFKRECVSFVKKMFMNKKYRE